MATIDRDRFQPLIDEGYIRTQHHPTLPLTIYNYAPKTQWEKCWTPETRMSRGLVIEDGTDRIVARPFPKFFNLSEMPEDWTPAPGPVSVAPKYDGSLLITFRYNGETIHATRGSFTGPQAREGARIFRRYNGTLSEYAEGWTYLHELIYPANRIVVSYNGLEMVVPLAKINTETGEDDGVYPGGTTYYDSTADFLAAVLEITQGIGDNEEGYVIRFSDGERVKIKGAEYVRLHRILTGVSEKRVWEALATGAGLGAFLEGVPDEFSDWVFGVAGRLQKRYWEIESEARAAHKKVVAAIQRAEDDGMFAGPANQDERERQKKAEFARLTLDTEYPQVVFMLRDGKDYSKAIWRLVKPTSAEATRPFVEDEA